MNEDTNVRSIYEDHVALVDTPLWRTDDQKGFSTTRWNEYKELFTQLGSPYIHRISKEGDVIEIASGSVVVSTQVTRMNPLLHQKVMYLA